MAKKIKVNGPIISSDEQWIYDWFGMDATSPAKVSNALEEANGDDIIVDISSEGGYVSSGSEIFTALKSYNGHVTTRIVSLAASAASVIAVAGDNVEMSPTAQFMIHNASIVAAGDKNDLTKTSEVLDTIDRSIVQAYVQKTGKAESELLEMMNKETWLTAKDAKELGFVDKVMFEEDTLKIVASSGATAMLPQQVINHLKQGGFKNSNESISSKDVQAMFAEFKNELLAEFAKNSTVEPTPEPEQTPEPEKKPANLFNLFINL